MLRSDTSLPVALTYDDIIFQARNQAYGAFVLRQQYRSTLSRALGLGVGLFLIGLLGPMLYNHLWPKDVLADQEVMVTAEVMKLPDKPAEAPIMLPKTDPAPAVNTVRNLPPVVMPEEDVIEENLPPTTEQLKEAVSGTETAEGTGEEEVIAASEVSAPTVREKAVEVETPPEQPFVAVEQNPEYPGGMEALLNFLGKNLNYPRAATSAGVSGRVYVSFVVNTDGSLTDIQVVKGIGFGCDQEAVRVMQKMPHWKPGKQSGRAVRVKFNLPIAFTLE